MRRLVPILFAVALGAFVLPFATVSCRNVSTEVTGAEFVLRAEPETRWIEPPPPGQPQVAPPASFGQIVVAYGGGLATASFLAFAFALVAALRSAGAWAAGAAIAGVLALVFLRLRDSGVAGGGGLEVDVHAGAFLAAGAGAAGALAAALAWRRRPDGAELTPLAGAGLIVVGVLLPSTSNEAAPHVHADALDVRHPWRAAFWVLVVGTALLLVAHRGRIGRDRATAALAVLGTAAVVAAQDILRLLREDGTQPGVARWLLLAGLVLLAAWVWRVRTGLAELRAAAPAQSAPALEAPRSGPSAPESV